MAMTRDDVMRETVRHANRVKTLVADCVHVILSTVATHDESKFGPEEFDSFAEVTPVLKGLTYGSDEYKANLKKIKPAIDHHNEANSHHPEHHPSGIDGMTLMEVLEMLCDWKAAGERHADGDILRSLEIGAKRFKIDPQLHAILTNTVVAMGWVSTDALEQGIARTGYEWVERSL